MLPLSLRHSQCKVCHQRLQEAGVAALPAFPASLLDAARDMLRDEANVARRGEELRRWLEAALAVALDHAACYGALGFDRATLATNYGEASALLRKDAGLLRRALLFLRATGEVMYYDNVPGLADRVFIKPQWLVDVMKELVRHDLRGLVEDMLSTLPPGTPAAEASRRRGKGARFLESGVLHADLLPWLWRGLPAINDSPGLVGELLLLLHQLAVALPWYADADDVVGVGTRDERRETPARRETRDERRRPAAVAGPSAPADGAAGAARRLGGGGRGVGGLPGLRLRRRRADGPRRRAAERRH